MEFGSITYNQPIKCAKCGGRMIFKGVGEYKCEDCQNIEFDDYGKVRAYIEKHKGATAAEIEAAIGIKQRVIRQMLKDSKIEVAPNSKAFLKCEICGIDIRSGRYCAVCETKKIRIEEEEKKKKNNLNKKGIGMSEHLEGGEKRFQRE